MLLACGPQMNEAYRTLKNNLCDASILSLPDGVEDFVVYYDASNQGLGCVLMQRNKKELNMRQRRWIELFSDYECEIRYHPGKANVVADALSRKEQGEAFNQENVLAERLHGLDQQMERKGDGSLYFMDRIWVPLVGGVRTVIMDEAHKSRYSVHPRADKMYYDLESCTGWPDEIPEWKWENITMDFITKLPRTRSGHDAIWVVVDRLTKSAHFLAIRKDYSTKKLARLYTDEIKALGTRLDMSTTYHPQTDGQSERIIQTLEDMLRARVIEFGGSWDVQLPSPVLWAEIWEGSLIGPELVQEMTDKVVVIKEKLKAARDRQKSYADNMRKTVGI
ncbi:putative reverse transcriptase domain-containing protein [Tanacetum coccineum]